MSSTANQRPIVYRKCLFLSWRARGVLENSMIPLVLISGVEETFAPG